MLAWILGKYIYTFMTSEMFLAFTEWVQNYIGFYIAVLILLKSFLSMIPPAPSLLLTLSAIPVLGWFNAYLIDFVGSMIGSSFSYYLGKKYGLPVIKFLFDKASLEKIKRIKIKDKREIESVAILRILTAPTLVEAVNYGAGLLKIGFNKFFVGSLISHPIVGIPTFILVRNVLDQKNVAVSAILIILSLLSIYLVKDRYFEDLEI